MKIFKISLLLLIALLAFSANSQIKTFEVKVVGKGEPILLFPGFTCTGDVWESVVPELSRNHECHIFTFAGFGDVAPIEKPWLPIIKAGVSDYIVSKKLTDVTIIGHSLGGTLALWLASEGDTNLKSIIVVDALPSTGALMMPNFNSETIVYDNPYSNRLLNMDEASFETMATKMAQGMTLNKEKQPLIKRWMIQADLETYVHGYTDLLKLDLRDDVSKINIPVTILAATHPYGEAAVKQTYTAQYQKLKDYTIDFATTSAHFIMFDQPEWLLTKINAVLQ